MNLATAQHYAEKLVLWLSDTCTRIEIAGSVRRGRGECNDIDLVVIPVVFQEKDMLGAVIAEKNLVHEFLTQYIRRSRGTRFIQGENLTPESKQIIVQLPKCQLDIFFASKENFASRLLSRTGSMEHNIWLCERAQRLGLHWNPYEGVRKLSGLGMPLLPADSEEAIYGALGLPFIEPKDRERGTLHRLFGEGK